MKRRDFIKAGAVTGSAVALAPLMSGCSDDDNQDENVIVNKKVVTRLEHNAYVTPVQMLETYNDDEKRVIDETFPDFVPFDVPHHTKDDQLFVANPGAKRLELINDAISSENLVGSTDDSEILEYESTSTVDSQSYIVHMYYKKIDGPYVSSDERFKQAYIDRNLLPQDTDDVLEDNPPKYKLSYLVLIVPNGDDDEVKVVDNPIRETVKTLLFRAPAFSSFTQDDMLYALSLFDTIFPNRTELETVINHAGMDHWFRYALHRDHEGNVVYRKTQTLDNDGNVIHAIGDPIYTYPIRNLFEKNLQNDHNVLVNALSMDERLAKVLLPIDDEEDQTRMTQWRSEIQKRATTYDGHEYRVESSNLKAVGGKLELYAVDADGIHLYAYNHYKRHMAVTNMELDPQQVPVGSLGEGVMLPPKYTLMGVPISDSKASVTFPFDKDSTTSRVYFSSWSFTDGLNHLLYFASDGVQNGGTGLTPITLSDVNIDVLKAMMHDPETMTVVFDLALPTALIALGGYNIAKGSAWKRVLAQYGAQFAYDIAGPIISNKNLSASDTMNAMVGPLISHIVAGQGELVAYLLQSMAENEVEDAVPVAGQILRALCLLANISNLAQSIYALSVAKSVGYVDVKRYHTLKINIRSDANDHSFPDDITTISVLVDYSNGDKATPYNFDWDRANIKSYTQDGGGSYQLYEIDLEDQPSGGDVEVKISLHRGSWVAAHGTKTFDSYTNDVTEIEITNNVIPLTGNSVYQHYAKLTNDGTGYKWNVKEDGATLASPALSDDLLEKNQLLKISVNDPIGAIGYSYRSLDTNKYNVKNISAVLESPNQGAKSYSANEMIQISYSLLSHESNEGSVIFEKKDGITYIRKIDINAQSNDFEIDFSKNIGTFITDNVTQFGYYQPTRTIAALDTEAGVIHIINHLYESVDDTSTDRYANVKSTPVTIKLGKDMDPNSQYFYNPKLLTMSPGGDIVVLEETLSGIIRLRAFDTNGYVYDNFEGFNNGSGTFSLKKEELSVTYLDISIEAKGFIYVLKRIGSDATNADNYHLDIYDPHSDKPTEPMVVTNGVSGGKMVVDYWRRVYTLNYETNELDEPTVSLWLPPV